VLVHGCSHAVSRAIDDLLKLELVVFLHQNPDTLDSAEGLSIRMGYASESITQALCCLVDAGLVVRHGDGERAVFRYTDDRDLRCLVEGDYFAPYHDRDSRRRLESLVASRGEA